MLSKQIFLIDDDPDDQELFLSALERSNLAFECKTANNGIEAFQKLTAGQVDPDIIFLDLNMPLMNGQQFLKKIKQEDTFKTIPIVIFTTTSNPKIINEVRKLGADNLITKPNSFKELVSLVSGVLSSI